MHAVWIVAVVHFALSLPPGVVFKPWLADRGVKIEIARAKDETPWIRGTFDIPAPPAKVIGAVSDFKHYKELFAPALLRADILESSPNRARLHLVWPYPSPMRDRDAVVVYDVQPTATGGAVLSWWGEARPKDPKVGVRIQHVKGETLIEPVAGGTHVVYTYLGDLGGNFPSSIEERAWKGEPVGYMQALRRAVGLPVLKKQ